MKKNMKFKLILFIILTIIVVCLFFIFNKKEDNKPNDNPNIDTPTEEPSKEEDKPDEVGTNYLNDVKYTVNVDKEVEDVIVEFLNVYYNSIKELKENDMTYLFKDSTSEQALINQTALSLLIETRKLKPNDLSLDKAKYDLDFTEVTTNGDTVEVTVLENNYLGCDVMERENYIIQDSYYLINLFHKDRKVVTQLHVQKLMFLFEAYYMNVTGEKNYMIVSLKHGILDQ